MDEEIAIIDNKTRREKIINFLLKNKKKLILIIAILVLIPLVFFSYQIYKNKNKQWIANKYNSTIINFEGGDKLKAVEIMKEIINDKDPTYSPLALYFLIDNNIQVSNEETNKFFDIIIDEVKLKKEIKNLVIYKKALFNSEFTDENSLITILNPLINSESIWTSHALYLVAEYFYFKNEKQKSKEFYERIISLNNADENILRNAQKKLNRNFSE
tara:strand:+ start:1061 stop:1705 length:645 start_codon:yes stop_codon:yes gene_type:complete